MNSQEIEWCNAPRFPGSLLSGVKTVFHAQLHPAAVILNCRTAIWWLILAYNCSVRKNVGYYQEKRLLRLFQLAPVSNSPSLLQLNFAGIKAQKYLFGVFFAWCSGACFRSIIKSIVIAPVSIRRKCSAELWWLPQTPLMRLLLQHKRFRLFSDLFTSIDSVGDAPVVDWYICIWLVWNGATSKL